MTQTTMKTRNSDNDPLLTEDSMPDLNIEGVGDQVSTDTDSSLTQGVQPTDEKKQRKPGGQPGAKGHARSSPLPIHKEEIHVPELCNGTHVW